MLLVHVHKAPHLVSYARRTSAVVCGSMLTVTVEQSGQNLVLTFSRVFKHTQQI